MVSGLPPRGKDGARKTVQNRKGSVYEIDLDTWVCTYIGMYCNPSAILDDHYIPIDMIICGLI